MSNPYDLDDPTVGTADILALGGETLTYYPGNGSDPWQFAALVDRGSPQQVGGESMTLRPPKVTIAVPIYVLPPTSVNASTQDQVSLPYPTRADAAVKMNIVLSRRTGVYADDGLVRYDLS